MFVYTKTKFGTYLENPRPESHDRLLSHYVPQATSNYMSEMELHIEQTKPYGLALHATLS